MIGKLKGLIDSYGEDLSFSTSAASATGAFSARTLQALLRPARPRCCRSETYVREDQINCSLSQ